MQRALWLLAVVVGLSGTWAGAQDAAAPTAGNLSATEAPPATEEPPAAGEEGDASPEGEAVPSEPAGDQPAEQQKKPEIKEEEIQAETLTVELPPPSTEATQHKIAADAPPAMRAFLEALNRWEAQRVANAEQLANEKSELRRIAMVRVQQRWTDGIIPQLVDAGLAAYAAKPGDPLTEHFLVQLAVKLHDRDQMEDALRIALGLIEHGYDQPQMALLAGRAAMEVGDVANASKWLKVAKFKETSDPIAEAFLKYENEGTAAFLAELQIRRNEEQANDLPRVKIETSRGDFVVELFENEYPNTVAYFLSLCARKYYEDRPFYAVRRGYYALAGDRNGDGTGDAGFNVYKERNPVTSVQLDVAQEAEPPKWRHAMRGSFVMLASGQHTVCSKFGIAFRSTTAKGLAQSGITIGRVVEGLDVVTKLQERDPRLVATGGVPPEKILRCTIVRQRERDYRPFLVRTHVEKMCNDAFALARDARKPGVDEKQKADLILQAMQTWEFALQLQPGHTRTLFGQAVIYMELKDNDAAIENFERICRNKPPKDERELDTYIKAYETLAMIYVQTKQHQKAIDTYRGLVKVKPDARAYSNLGTLLMNQSKHKEARKAFEKALEIDPTYQQAQANLQKLP